MKKSFFAAVAFSAVFAFAGGAFAQAGDGWLSRYWDGCKPSCSWSGKQYNGQGQCKECDKSNNKMNTSDGNRSSCDGGNSYTCWDMSPWAVDNTTAYGYAAAHKDQQCGTCWELTFNGSTQHAGNGDASVLRGKKLTVMISNIGGDVQGNQLDFLVPGGGVGQFDSFSSQIGVSSSALGERYGGLLSAGCQGNPTCLKGKCDQVFGGSGKEWLKAGCYFYAEWMGAIGNPQYNAKSVTCPSALTDRWKNAATGTPGGSVNPTPTPTTYTLTVNRNPAGGGTTNPENSKSNIASGTQVDISTTVNNGYTFNNWTVTSGSGTIANASSASTKVTVNGNVTVTANYTQNATTYTLTVEKNPTAGGNAVAGNNQTTQSNINAGTQINISATANTGYTFSNWTITSGSGNIANANSASTSITVNGNVTVRANFTLTPTNYTLTVNRNPTAGGSVTANNQSNPASVTVAGGTSVPIVATAASGYTFTNWTVTAGTAQIGNANSASTTISLSANATISANFTKNPTTPTQYTLTVSRLPSNNAGTVSVKSQNYTAPIKLDGGVAAAIAATPAAGYKFTSWTVSYGNASIANANSATTTVTLTEDALIVANFTTVSTTPPSGGGGNRTDTTRIEAESYTSKNGDIQIGKVEDAGGGMCIGYIGSGNSTTYNNVSVARSGVYTMQFRIALGDGGQTSFTVNVNGTNVGTVSTNNTGGWNNYVIVALSNDVQLNAGSNTVVLNFQGAVNVDYFLLLGEPGSSTPVRYRAATESAPRMNIAVRADAKGFKAELPANHGYTSYKIIDARGKTIRSGKIAGGVTDLRFNNVNSSVMFLKLDGKKNGAPLVLKAITY